MTTTQMLREAAFRAYRSGQGWYMEKVIPYLPSFNYVNETYACMASVDLDRDRQKDADCYFLLLCAEAEKGRR